MPYYNRDPKRDHNFDNHQYGSCRFVAFLKEKRGRGGVVLGVVKSYRGTLKAYQVCMKLSQRFHNGFRALLSAKPILGFRV